MTDTLTAGTGPVLEGIRAALEAALPAPSGVTVHAGEPDPAGSTPFVLLVLNPLTPTDVTLSGEWGAATIAVQAWSVHDTIEQATALDNLVREWFLDVLTGPIAGGVRVGLVEAPGLGPEPGNVAGVRQVYSTFELHLSRGE